MAKKLKVTMTTSTPATKTTGYCWTNREWKFSKEEMEADDYRDMKADMHASILPALGEEMTGMLYKLIDAEKSGSFGIENSKVELTFY